MNKLHISPRFILTILTLVVIFLAAAAAIFLAKGYRFSPEKKTFSGTGILSITSVPDQASVYLDGHLTTATNANINSLLPKSYTVKVIKEGFIPWEKKIEVEEGLVTDIKATLFPAIPTVYPLTYNGVQTPVLSPDGQKLAFVVPGDGKKSGIWVWTMSERPITFARGSEPHQVAAPQPGIDFTKASLRFSPESSQILVTLPDRTLLLDQDKLNDVPRDITAILEPTLKNWEDEIKQKDIARLETIKDLNLRKIASASALLKWSPDETKFLYVDELIQKNQKINFKVADLTEKKNYNLPSSQIAMWLPNSRHLVLVADNKISIVEFDGINQAVIYAGNFNDAEVYPWPDGSRLMMVSSFPTPTAQEPNLYGINLK